MRQKRGVLFLSIKKKIARFIQYNGLTGNILFTKEQSRVTRSKEPAIIPGHNSKLFRNETTAWSGDWAPERLKASTPQRLKDRSTK